jgi:eukaryotic-like serine/threonine-protein kinase
MGYLMHHVHTPPRAPSERAELPIPAAFDALVLACLAKDPAARPQSAKELADRLAEIETPGLWQAEQARAWWDRHQPERRSGPGADFHPLAAR